MDRVLALQQRSGREKETETTESLEEGVGMTTPRARGCDLRARYQPRYDAKVGRHDFVAIQACYGTSKDAGYDQLHEDIQPVPLRGAYLYFLAAQNWLRQVEFFLEIVQGGGYHFYALDFEQKSNEAIAAADKTWREAALSLPPENASKSKRDAALKKMKEAQSKVWQFGANARLAMAHMSDIGGLPVLLYTGKPAYQSWLQDHGHDWMKNYGLWFGQYPFKTWNNRLYEVPLIETWQPDLPRGVEDWVFWQYSADGNRKGVENGLEPWPKASADIDLDVANGSVAELYELFGVNQPALPRSLFSLGGKERSEAI